MAIGNRPNGAKYTEEQVIAAAMASRGIISEAADMLGCGRRTVYNYIKRNEKIEQAFGDARERMIDTAEGTLFDRVEAKEQWATAFILKTIGKNRGYTERQEIAGPDNEPVQFNIQRRPAESKDED